MTKDQMQAFISELRFQLWHEKISAMTDIPTTPIEQAAKEAKLKVLEAIQTTFDAHVTEVI